LNLIGLHAHPTGRKAEGTRSLSSAAFEIASARVIAPDRGVVVDVPVTRV
jgi:hypothetical protein